MATNAGCFASLISWNIICVITSRLKSKRSFNAWLYDSAATTGYSNFKQSCWALMPHNGSVCLRCMDRQTAVSQWVSISGNRAFGHCSDLDLWPLTLKTFVAMAIHMLIARAKFHRVKRYCTTWNEQPLTDGQCTDGRHSARWQTRRYKPLATYCWQWMPRT